MDFQERYNNFQQELRDLKTGHNARSNMRTFFASITVPDMATYTTTYIRITYADGDQPIMTTHVGLPNVIPLKPSGNTQDYLIADLGITTFYRETISFLSTRKIESIQIIQ